MLNLVVRTSICLPNPWKLLHGNLLTHGNHWQNFVSSKTARKWNYTIDISFWVSICRILLRSQRAQRSLETCPRHTTRKADRKCECKATNSRSYPSAWASAQSCLALVSPTPSWRCTKGLLLPWMHKDFGKCKVVCIGHTWLIVPISLYPLPGILQEDSKSWNYPP